MKFRGDFGAEDEARLTPCEDDKPKYTEITQVKAWFGYLLSPYYLASIAISVPAAIAEPITPATFGPIACIRRKFEGFSLCPTF